MLLIIDRSPLPTSCQLSAERNSLSRVFGDSAFYLRSRYGHSERMLKRPFDAGQWLWFSAPAAASAVEPEVPKSAALAASSGGRPDRVNTDVAGPSFSHPCTDRKRRQALATTTRRVCRLSVGAASQENASPASASTRCMFARRPTLSLPRS